MKTTAKIGIVCLALLLLAIVGCQRPITETPVAEGLSETSLGEDVQDLQDLDQLSDEFEDSSFEELDNLGLD